MKSLDKAYQYYIEFVAPMLNQKFGDCRSLIAVGMSGKGSENYGFDDDISCDHDIAEGVGIWLTSSDDDRIGYRLIRAYDRLAKECGIKKPLAYSKGSLQKTGVIIIEEFFRQTIGFDTIPQEWQPWFFTPSNAFAEATNGKVFEDNLGVWTQFRKDLYDKRPVDVMLKKLSAHLILAGQAGQYNYARMLAHGEIVGSQLAIFEFCKHIIAVIFELEKTYMPYYKWQIRMLDNMTNWKNIIAQLDFLMTTNNIKQSNIKQQMIEDICKSIIQELKKYGYSDSDSDLLESHAYKVQSLINNKELSQMHIMEYGEM